MKVKRGDIVIVRNDEPFMDETSVGFAYRVTEVHPETNFVVCGYTHIPMQMIVCVVPRKVYHGNRKG